MAPQRHLGGLTSLIGKEIILGNEKVNKRNRLKFVDSGDSPGDSQRPDYKRFAEDSPGYDTLTEHEGTTSRRRKRVAEDNMYLIQENLDFNYDEQTGYRVPVGHGDLMESLYNSRRPSKENQSLYSDPVKTFEIPQTEPKRSNHDQRFFMDQKVGYNCSSVSSPKSIISKHQSSETFFVKGKRGLNDDRVQMRDIRGDGDQIELKGPINDQRLFVDRKVDCVHSSVGGNRVSNSLAKLRRISDDYEQIRFGRSMNNDITPIVSNTVGKVRRATDDDRWKIPAERFSTQLEYGGKLNYQESSDNACKGLGLVTPAVHSGHLLDRTKQLNSKYRLLKNDEVDNIYTFGNNEIKLGYADTYLPEQQPSFISSKPTLEAHYSPSKNQHTSSSMFPSSVEERMYVTSYPSSFEMEKNTHGVSYLTSHDCVLTRSVPYNPDFSEVNGTPLSVKGLISQSDGSLRRASEVRMHENQDPYEHYDPRVVDSFLSGGYREQMGNPSITDEIYEGKSLFSKIPIYDKQNMSPSSEFNEHLVKNKFLETVTDSTSSHIQNLLIKYGMGSSIEKINDSDINSYHDLNAVPTDSENRRTSVFARLSRPVKKHGPKKALDASVDQVMETVYECLSQKITKANKHSLLDIRHNKEETFGAKKQEKRSNQKLGDVAKTDDKPTMMTQKMVIKEKVDDVLNETRVVEFKRRSETIRRQNGEKSTECVQKLEGGKRAGEEGKAIKRRKLIRPVFGKKEELNDNSRGDELSNSASFEFSGTRLGNLKRRSSNSQICKKLVGPVFSEKGELNYKHSDLQISSEIKDSSCDFSGSLENPNSLSPNSRKKLVRQSFGKKELNDDYRRDAIPDLNLLSSCDSSDNQKAATCEFADENFGYLNSASLISGSLELKASTGSGESRVTATNPKL